jgi:hypothetical protein
MARISDVFLDRRLILGGAVMVWLLFATSLLMPSYVERDGLAVWELFRDMMSAQVNIPLFWRAVQEHPRVILNCTFLFTNTLMMVAPAVLRAWPQCSAWMALALALGAGAAYVRFLHMMAGDHLASGFYCWITSVLLMAGVFFWNCGSYFRVAEPVTDTRQPDPLN